MTGGVTEAVSVHAGDHVTARVQHLGTVGVRFA
jgi:2-oxo-3-hexenedioate decarboxylase